MADHKQVTAQPCILTVVNTHLLSIVIHCTTMWQWVLLSRQCQYTGLEKCTAANLNMTTVPLLKDPGQPISPANMLVVKTCRNFKELDPDKKITMVLVKGKWMTLQNYSKSVWGPTGIFNRYTQEQKKAMLMCPSSVKNNWNRCKELDAAYAEWADLKNKGKDIPPPEFDDLVLNKMEHPIYVKIWIEGDDDEKNAVPSNQHACDGSNCLNPYDQDYENHLVIGDDRTDNTSDSGIGTDDEEDPHHQEVLPPLDACDLTDWNEGPDDCM